MTTSHATIRMKPNLILYFDNNIMRMYQNLIHRIRGSIMKTFSLVGILICLIIIAAIIFVIYKIITTIKKTIKKRKNNKLQSDNRHPM